MRPLRQRMGGGFGSGFSSKSMATRITIGIAALSIFTLIAQRLGWDLLSHLLLSPTRVIRGELWQVITYAWVYPLGAGGIFSFLISLWFLYVIGNQVEAILGSRRFLGFFIGTTALGAILTVPIAFIAGVQSAEHAGLWAGLGALTILFAHHFANQPVYLMFVLPVKGRQLTWVAFGIVGLYALMRGSVIPALPPFLSMLAALAFVHGLFQPRRAWLRFRAWRIERELKRRTRKFSVIDGEKKEDPPTAIFPPKGKDSERGPWLH